MSDYRRYLVLGATYFFTVVTERRAPVFADQAARRLLGSVIRRCLLRRPLKVGAVVLLPDHLHCLWALPARDCAYSERWRWIKREFTRDWLACGGAEQPRRTSRQRRRGVWQRRFWEHTIRDETDLENHFDYIHYNPVKHGLVQRPRDWPWSSFHRWCVPVIIHRIGARTPHTSRLPATPENERPRTMHRDCHARRA